MLINFYIVLADKPETKEIGAKAKAKNGKEKRIRVNDKTATGGWF